MEWYFFLILASVAMLYSAVGHGGASGYLALMAIIGIAPEFMRPTALILNLFVSGISFISFYRNGHFKWELLFPFIVTSIPMAYLGGRTSLDPHIYKLILGVFLIVATIRMAIKPNKTRVTIPFKTIYALLIGGFLGFFAGMIGIGGGIILTPILIFLGWADVKKAAAVSAPFIFVNSMAGLAGIYKSHLPLVNNTYLWVIIAFSGGLIGSHLGSKKLSINGLRYVLAGIMATASIKLFMF